MHSCGVLHQHFETKSFEIKGSASLEGLDVSLCNAEGHDLNQKTISVKEAALSSSS